MKATLDVGLVQMRIADGCAGENLARAQSLLEAAPPADLYLLPELWTTGYAHAAWCMSAQRDTPLACETLQRLSTERGAWIGSSMISLDARRGLTNRFWLFAPDGRAPVTYDKGHLFSPLREDTYLAAGTERVRAEIDGWTAGLSICFDLRFPEMYRHDALDGANLFLVVAEWPQPRACALRVLAHARAIENQAFLALCNRTGSAADGLAFGGASALFAPDGAIVVEAGSEEQVVVGTVDCAPLTELRAASPVLARRRAGLDW